MGWDWGVNLMYYGSALQKRRMFLHQFLHHTAMKRHHGILTLETHRLMTGLSDSPENYLDHVRRYSSPILPKSDVLRTLWQGNGCHYNENSIWP
jgi:hypothetical protein